MFQKTTMELKIHLQITSYSEHSTGINSPVSNVSLKKKLNLDFIPQIGNKIQLFMEPSSEDAEMLDSVIKESDEICTGIFLVLDVIFRPDLSEVELLIGEQEPFVRSFKECFLTCKQLILGYGFLQDL